MYSCGNYINENALRAVIEKQRDKLILYKNTDLKFEACTAHTAKVLNYKSPDQLIGVTDHEIQAPVYTIAEQFIEEDKRVFMGKKLTVLDMLPTPMGFIVTTTHRIPVVDEKMRICGSAVISHTMEKDNAVTRFMEQMLKLEKKSCLSLITHEENVLLTEDDEYALTPKELSILWLFARGMTAKKIAICLDRSPRTIEDHLENIKNKYACSHKSALIEKAIHRGILNYLPPELVKTHILEAL